MPAKVCHAHLYGTREAKYETLLKESVKTTEWADLDAKTPNYFFVPRNERGMGEYDQGWKITDVMPSNTTGIVTARDGFVIDFEDAAIIKRLELFRDPNRTDRDVKEVLGLSENYAWRVSTARKEFMAEKDYGRLMQDVLYRPFDVRRIIYHPSVVWRPREATMRHMLAGENLGMAIGRAGQVIDTGPWDILFCTRTTTEFNLYRRGGNCLFPLYIYPPYQIEATDWKTGPGGRLPNLAPEFVEEFAGKLGLAFVSDGRGDLKKSFGPEDIFNYAYAVFHSPTYRSRYAEFLKIDFPRLPLTSSAALFRKLCALGDALVKLHLLEAPELAEVKFRPRYPVKGDNHCEKPRYDDKKQRVFVNAEQYFEPVGSEVWNFHVGGYQVAEKWLKDRAKAGRTLSLEDLEHYAKTLAALRETIKLMAEVDKAIPKWPIG